MTSPQAAPPAAPPSAARSAPLMTIRGPQTAWLGRIFTTLFLLALFVPPFLFGEDRYWLPLFTRYVSLAIFALSVDLIWGYTGLLSLGQGLYFGLGVYAVGYSLKLQMTAEKAGAPPGTA